MVGVDLGEAALDEDARLAGIRPASRRCTPGRSAEMTGACPGSTVKSPSTPGTTTWAASSDSAMRSGVTSSNLNVPAIPRLAPPLARPWSWRRPASGVCSLVPQNGQKNTGWSTMLGSSSFSGSTMPIDM